MLFNSLHFLIFFPVVTLFYFLLPHRVRYIWLLFASYYFYMCWNPTYALLMLTSTAITYASGLLLTRAKTARQRKWTVAISFIANLSILFFFKYYYFTLDNINRVLGLLDLSAIPAHFDVILPVGISFYTFQALSYTMDVYRGELAAEKNFLKYALFVSFFPQLVAGPIERSTNLVKQIHERHCFDYARVKRGLMLMLWGFFQKLVIADRLAIVVANAYGDHTAYNGWQLLVATLCFTFQIYCDFASYTDIARGAAEVMGFRLMRNFRQPYFSTSIADFWRNWHISLSTWFRDYLYIPLGGNRGGTLKKYRNIMIVFLASGLWHGASWHFVAWGVIHGVYQIIGGVTRKVRDNAYKLVGIRPDGPLRKSIAMICTFALVVLTWVFFRAENMTQSLQIIKSIFTNLSGPATASLGLDMANWIAIGASLMPLLLTDICNRRGICVRDQLLGSPLVIRWIAYYIIIFVILIFGIYGPGFSESQFIYFQF